jgi:glycosyltransferase involved in cell wall biosynthesis
MKLVFVDPLPLDYTSETPLNEPLGGAQSAVAYLSAELVRQGQDVCVINGVAEARMSAGVQFLGLNMLTTGLLDQFDAVIMVSEAQGHRLRAAGVKAPMVLWCHHAHDQPAVQGLLQAEERAAWNGFAMLSRWQADNYASAFGVPRERMAILGNAVSPPMLTAPEAAPWFLRGDPPVLAYTSTPFRGLDMLLQAFPAILELVPGARLRVYSGMSLYRVRPENDPHAALYEACRALPGAEYVGPVSQSELARALVEVDVHAYPCTFAETACIAAMEAMASGAMIVTTNLGALAETTGGFGHLMDFRGKHGGFALEYAAFMVGILNEAMRAPEPAAAKLVRQRRYARENYSWERRARQWVGWLPNMIGKAL